MRAKAKPKLGAVGLKPSLTMYLQRFRLNSLGSVTEIESPEFQEFMAVMNAFAARHGMRIFRNWSKVWEYPWLWMNGLGALAWRNLQVVDIGSEISPMPWILAVLGARVILVETNPDCIPFWEAWRRELGVDVDWRIVAGELLPIADEWADVVTSFSVIEHQRNKELAVNEIVRVLKRGGVLGISFDLCESGMGMLYPVQNGSALTFHEFERTIWSHPAFGNAVTPEWNLEDIPGFLEWHSQGNPWDRYTVGATILQKNAEHT